MLKLARLYDQDQIAMVLKDPEMFNRISEDGQNSDELEIPLNPDFHWVGIFLNDALIGVYWLHPISSMTGYIHTHILKPYRKKYSFEAGYLMMKYIISCVHFNKLETKIPVIYEGVLQYARNMGFREEGISRRSFFKTGQMIDQHCMGITRQEINHWLDEFKEIV